MQKTQAVPSDLHVVTMISNPRRFRSRYQLYEKFRKHIEDTGARLTTIELAFGDRPFELPTDCIRMRTRSEVWHKENALNLAIARLPDDWKYVAWVDADVQFARHDWVDETLHMLQHHPIVQPWSIAHDLSPDYENFQAYTSFAYCYQQFISRYPKEPLVKVMEILKRQQGYGTYGYFKGNTYWHSGYAWAARREAIDHLGGLIDFAAVGAGDHHMALALVGRVQESVPGSISPPYLAALLEWQRRAEVHIRRNIGYVPGQLNHHWHGKKGKRGYMERWEIITRNRFDPLKDLKYDSHGLIQLVDRGDDRSRRLRDDLMHYFAQRNEDSVDME